jgi:DNA polymerase III subunit beta
MQLQVLQENLAKTLNICSRFASSKVQLPVLANVLFRTSKNKLVLSATNLETSVCISMGAKVEEDGEITVPSRVISEIITNLNPGQVSLVGEKETLKIESAGFESSVSGMNPSDFPPVPEVIGGDAIQVPSNDLRETLSACLFAVSTDETRPVLTGILAIVKEGEITFVATDGFRLSQKKIKIPKVKSESKVIIPKGALIELARLSNEDDSVNFSIEKAESRVLFGVSSMLLTSRIIEGEFPDFERIIPRAAKIKVSLDKDEFLQAVKLASIFARDSANVVKLGVSEGKVELTAESSGSGNQKKEIAAKVESDPPLKEKFVIAFNYRFLEDFLGVVKGEDVQLELSDPNAPALFLDPKANDFLHIIMPVRLQS